MSSKRGTGGSRRPTGASSILGDTTLARTLSGNIAVLVLFVASAVGAMLLYGSYRTIDQLSDRAIEQAMERTEAELARVFHPIEQQGEAMQAWTEAGELRLRADEVDNLTQRLRPLVEQNDQLSAVSLADPEGREYVAWQDGDTWVSRYTEAGAGADDPSLWIRWDEDGEELERWEGVRDEDARQRPWYEGAMSVEEGQPYWSEPFIFFMNDERGMTMSRRYRDPYDGTVQVLAFGVSLADLSAFTSRMMPTENGYTAVVTERGELVGLPAPEYYDDVVVEDDVMSTWEDLGITSLGQALETWRDEDRPATKIEGRDDDMGRYWAGLNHFELGQQPLVVATVAPRSDLTGIIDRHRNMTIGFSLVAIIIAALLGSRMSKRYQERMTEIYDHVHHLGQYKLEAKLGVGGMGEVYRAEHGMLKRPTAVKLLKPDMYDQESIKRFEREVRLSCRLSHPNTVTIFDYGKTDSGLFYYAMELLEGVTLGDFLDYTGPLSEGRVIYLLTQICGALIEAHDIGLIHRDVKPGNVMVGSGAGLADQITVLDFGLVKDIHAPEQTQLTQREYLQGSPGYMAPEVILGEEADTPKVDIFAVGAVGYKLLCGTNPFSGDSPVKIMMAQVEEEPDRPSNVLGRDVDSDLESLIMDCLEKEPGARPAMMMEVLERLMACQAARDWTSQEAIEWWEEHEDAVIATIDSPVPVESSEAFRMTLTMGPEGTATIDTAPDVVEEDDDSSLAIPEVEGLGMEETLPQDDDEGVG